MRGKEEKQWTIKEVAAASGLAPSAIRYYEGEGILPPARRAPNGYRLYGEEDARRLRFVRNARSLALTADDIRQALALRERDEAPCGHVIERLEERVADVGRRIAELRELEAELQMLLDAARALPQDDVAMEQCVCALIRRKDG